MYLSPDTPLHVKKIQQDIWLSKPIEERLRLSANMIDDAIKLQLFGIKMRHPEFSEKDAKRYRLLRMAENDPALTWLIKMLDV
jgi:hypothetical protein